MARAFFRALMMTAAVAVSVSPFASAQADPGTPVSPSFPALAGPPWLGVSMDAGGDIGVTVGHVVRGSPADKGGLQAGDRIVAIDGNSTTVPGHVTRAVGARKVGETVTVALERRGSATTASVVLASRPSGDEILKMDLVGAPAPLWKNVTAIAGAPAGIDKLKGRVVLVDFWASWCGPCRMLAPRLSVLKDKYGAQGLSVVGITTDDAEKAAVFAEKTQMRYGVVVDKDGDTSRAYGVTALPTMLLVDKKGIVREVFVGYHPDVEARVETALKALLAESAPPAAPLPPPTPTVPRPTAR